MLKELALIRPRLVITMGSQVSSTLLSRQISVSNYARFEYEELVINGSAPVKVFPTYYPVGQGTRNMPQAIARIKNVTAMEKID